MPCPLCKDSTATDTNDCRVCKTRYVCVFCAKRLSYHYHTLKRLDVAAQCATPTCTRIVGRAHVVCIQKAGRIQIVRCLDHYVEAIARESGLLRAPAALVGDYLSAPDYKGIDLRGDASPWWDEAKGRLPLLHVPVQNGGLALASPPHQLVSALVGDYIADDKFPERSARAVVAYALPGKPLKKADRCPGCNNPSGDMNLLATAINRLYRPPVEKMKMSVDEEAKSEPTFRGSSYAHCIIPQSLIKLHTGAAIAKFIDYVERYRDAYRITTAHAHVSDRFNVKEALNIQLRSVRNGGRFLTIYDRFSRVLEDYLTAQVTWNDTPPKHEMDEKDKKDEMTMSRRSGASRPPTVTSTSGTMAASAGQARARQSRSSTSGSSSAAPARSEGDAKRAPRAAPLDNKGPMRLEELGLTILNPGAGPLDWGGEGKQCAVCEDLGGDGTVIGRYDLFHDRGITEDNPEAWRRYPPGLIDVYVGRAAMQKLHPRGDENLRGNVRMLAALHILEKILPEIQTRVESQLTELRDRRLSTVKELWRLFQFYYVLYLLRRCMDNDEITRLRGDLARKLDKFGAMLCQFRFFG